MYARLKVYILLLLLCAISVPVMVLWMRWAACQPSFVSATAPVVYAPCLGSVFQAQLADLSPVILPSPLSYTFIRPSILQSSFTSPLAQPFEPHLLLSDLRLQLNLQLFTETIPPLTYILSDDASLLATFTRPCMPLVTYPKAPSTLLIQNLTTGQQQRLDIQLPVFNRAILLESLNYLYLRDTAYPIGPLLQLTSTGDDATDTAILNLLNAQLPGLDCPQSVYQLQVFP